MPQTAQFNPPDGTILKTAMVLQDIRDVLKNQKNNRDVSISADTPNDYYWAQFDPLDEDMWFDEFYGDIREIPSFGTGLASEKQVVLEFLQERGVVKSIKINSTFEDPEDMGWKDYEVIHSFALEIDLIKFFKYYDKYVLAALPALNQYLVRCGRNTETIPKLVTAKKEVDSGTREVVVKAHIHQLEPKHYSVRKGILSLSPTLDLSIAIKGKTRRPDGKKYLQCELMEKLFKTVNTLKSGIYFRTFLGVNDHLIDRKAEKKIRNTVTEINNKVSEVGGPKSLIKIQNQKIFVNSSYL
jgi:hypothetical protein